MRPTAFLAALCCVVPLNAARPSFVPNYDEAKVPAYALPNPLITNDGSPIRDAQSWRERRRPEIMETFAREVYGRTPAGRPAKMHWAVTSTDRAALGGKAVRKEITIWFTEGESGPKVHLLLYQPPGAAKAHAPWPAFLGLNFNGNSTVTAEPAIAVTEAWLRPVGGKQPVPERGSSAPAWSVETVVARGYATATIYYGELCEDRVEGLSTGVAALFKTGGTEERNPDAWGAIGVWAWGLSRAMDYLASDPEIDAKRVAVHGHSRLGKAALWAGAQDERFALVISNDSGCGGAALSKREFGETVERINTSFPHWFARNFRAYDKHESALPVDQHELIAAIAPRAVHVASAEDDQWADPRGEFLGAKHAEPVYALYGKKGLGVADMPAVNHPVLGDGVAYHIRTGKHAITPYDWAQYLDFADRVMKR